MIRGKLGGHGPDPAQEFIEVVLFIVASADHGDGFHDFEVP
jgi:hypothetical protein